MGATKRQREPPENSKSELVAGTSGGGKQKHIADTYGGDMRGRDARSRHSRGSAHADSSLSFPLLSHCWLGHASCAVCLKTADETDEKALRENHGCSTCASGAWRICVACHDSLLSRDCPLCRSPYEGLELFPFEFSADPPHDTER